MPYQHGGTIKDALEQITSNKYVLPAIQREFVWRPEQICALFDSVMQRYPFGEFLFWRVEPDHAYRYRYYGFVCDYHQRDNPHCPDLGIILDKPLTAILDGQQRLTAFNIGLRGSMAMKLPNRWWTNPEAFPRRVLALNVLSAQESDDEGNRFEFSFVDEENLGKQRNDLWFKVSDILKFRDGSDINDWLMAQAVEDRDDRKNSFRTLERLRQAIAVDHTIVIFEETSQDVERVLHIFIRRNSGGTVFSYSDLLLSIAVSQWQNLDARREIHELVDEMNRIGSGFNFSKDFVLKAGLMLADISSIGFKVENFTHENMKKLEKNWKSIRRALITTVELVVSYGFGGRTIRAESALLPIAYYLYQQGYPNNFVTHGRYKDDRDSIRRWLTRSLLKASDIWGSGLDTLLTRLRRTLQKNDIDVFPELRIYKTVERIGKGLNFEEEEIKELGNMEYKDRRLFALMSLLFPVVDFRNHFHIDHVFPYSAFSRTRLKRSGIEEDEIDKYRAAANRLANLQLLEGRMNNEKRAKPPSKWLVEQFRTKRERQDYCNVHELGEIPEEIADFKAFYVARRERLRQKIKDVLSDARR